MQQLIRMVKFSLWAIGLVFICSCTANTALDAEKTFDQATVALEVKETLILYYARISENGLLSELDFLDSCSLYMDSSWLPHPINI